MRFILAIIGFDEDADCLTSLIPFIAAGLSILIYPIAIKDFQNANTDTVRSQYIISFITIGVLTISSLIYSVIKEIKAPFNIFISMFSVTVIGSIVTIIIGMIFFQEQLTIWLILGSLFIFLVFSVIPSLIAGIIASIIIKIKEI